MLTDRQIQKNKEEYIALINMVHRDGFRKAEFLQMLEESDFYYAPASTRFHNAFPGGLVDHKLHTYNNAKLINTQKNLGISHDSIVLGTLGHDLGKINFYEIYQSHKKAYSDHGSKSDINGRFDWVAEGKIGVRDASERFIYGTHAQNSERILSSYCPLSEEESMAILNHHPDWNGSNHDITPIFSKYPLIAVLHAADLLACYVDEV